MIKMKARYKKRDPDPGMCDVLLLDSENKKAAIRKKDGCTYFPSFDEVFIFIHSKRIDEKYFIDGEYYRSLN